MEDMKIRRRELLAGFLGGLILCMTGSVGCAASAMTWISLGLSLIATLLPAIPSIVAGFASLVGKSLSAAQLAKIQSIFAGITNILQQVQTAIQNFEANPVASVIDEIKTLLNQLVANLNVQAILNDLQITNPAVVAKITAIVNVILGLATEILNILPDVTAGSPKAVKRMTAALDPKGFAAKLNAAIWIKTDDADVNAAFEKIEAVPKTVKK